MTNIVERLRDPFHMHDSPAMREAADLIESLQARVKELEAHLKEENENIAYLSVRATEANNELAALRQKIEDAPSVAYERKVHGGFAVTYIPSGAGDHEELIRKKDLK